MAEEVVEKKLTGRELAESLARQLQLSGWMAWVNMPMGSVLWSNPGIADVIAISKSHSNTTVKVYEVKASRNDFWTDVNRGKYLRYMKECNQFYFAAPAGMLKRGEIPQGCGLITLGDHGWHVQMGARRNECELSREFLMALLIKGHQDYLLKMRAFKDKDYYEYRGLTDAAAKYGKRLAQELAIGPEYLQEAQELSKKVGEALGENHDSLDLSIWSLRQKVSELLNEYKFAEEVTELTSILKQLFRGNTYQAPEALREIANKLEAKRQGGEHG